MFGITRQKQSWGGVRWGAGGGSKKLVQIDFLKIFTEHADFCDIHYIQ